MKTIFLTGMLFLFANLVFGSGPYKGEGCLIKSEFIFKAGEVPFPSCHASTIAETNKGLIAAWFGGTAEKNPDVGIWVSRYANGQWSEPEEVANGIQHKNKRYPCWNPVLFNAGREILLFYKVGPSPSSWWGEVITSADNGKSWSTPCRLPEDIYGPVKNKPVLLKNGNLLCPSSTENDGWRIHLEMTRDLGQTWERTTAINEKTTGAIQPALLLHPSGQIQMLCRSTGCKILTSMSDDNGYSWNSLTATDLPNPNSGIDAVTLKDGRYLVVYNHIGCRQNQKGGGRNILNVAVSEDGIVWQAAALLENDLQNSEYSYPAVIQTKDGMVHITYTWQRKQIRHIILDPAKIAPRPFLNGEWPED